MPTFCGKQHPRPSIAQKNGDVGKKTSMKGIDAVFFRGGSYISRGFPNSAEQGKKHLLHKPNQERAQKSQSSGSGNGYGAGENTEGTQQSGIERLINGLIAGPGQQVCAEGQLRQETEKSPKLFPGFWKADGIDAQKHGHAAQDRLPAAFAVPEASNEAAVPGAPDIISTANDYAEQQYQQCFSGVHLADISVFPKVGPKEIEGYGVKGCPPVGHELGLPGVIPGLQQNAWGAEIIDICKARQGSQ